MNRITPQDIRKGVETVSASPESTWYKVVETLDNGDELCLAIGMGEGFDEDTICAKLGVLAGNSAMSDYELDFVMPWNLGEGDNDIWDTEVSNPNESDAEWFNEAAQEMIRGFEDGTIGTSLLGSSCGKKKGKKKPVKSSRRPIQSMYVTQDISGNDLYTCLWSGGKDQFDSMIEDGADADDILNACEELLFREEGNPPTMTELNDLIWFEPDTIREYIGLSNPIESGCHGKTKKKAKKPVQSMARGYLQPEYDSRASFYNKAEFDDDKLYSYGTLVAEIVDGKPVLYPDWDYSQTTIRHVREFLRQHGFTADSKAQIAKDYLTNSRKPIKSEYSDVEKALNELEDYFNRSADGNTIWTYISHDDENHIAKVCEDYNVDFAVGGNHVTLYPIESSYNSRKPVKSGLYDEANAFDPKDYDFNKVYDFIYKKYSERIERELDNLLYNIQKELGITTGDTLLDKEDCVNKLVEILTDQYGNRS